MWQSLQNAQLDPDAQYVVLYALDGLIGDKEARMYLIMRGRDLQRWKNAGVDLDIMNLDDIQLP